MLIQVRGVLVHAMSGIELSRVRTEFRLRLPEPINKSPLESRRADIVMQSCGFGGTHKELRCGAWQFGILGTIIWQILDSQDYHAPLPAA
jgi:hypothetical protein